MTRILHRTVLISLYLTGLGLLIYFAVRGFDYYRTPLIERPRHDLYWTFKPGGTWGVRFGMVGAGMMILMLGYSLRKRVGLLRRLGPVAMWLDYHIFLGVCGPLFIVLHSSFKVQGLVALSFWAMVAVALSGVLGRYLYRQIPRTRAGDELSLQAVEKADRTLSQRLVNEFDLSREAVARLDALAEAGIGQDRSLVSLLFRTTADGVMLRFRLRQFRQEVPGIDPRLRRQFERTVQRKAHLRRRIVLWQRLRQLFHYWHVIHKPFALIMYLFMIVHVGVAWITGYAG